MNKLMLSETFLYRFRFVFGYLLLVTVGLFSLFYRLGTLLPGINSFEGAVASKSMSLGLVAENPVNFLYHGLQYLSIKLLGPTAFGLRLPGVIIAILAVFLFFWIIENRFSKRAAIVASLLLVTSSWFLNVARLGTPSVLMVLLVLLLVYISTKLNEKYKLSWLLLLVAASALSLYTPYFIYLLVFGLLLSLPSLKNNFKVINSKHALLGCGLFALLVIPLIYSIFKDIDVAKELLVFPENFPAPAEYFQNLSGVVGHVIWRSETLPILHLGTLPMLEIFSVSMVALGLYHYDHELSRNLSRIVLGGLTFTILLLAINGNQFDYALMLPFVYFVLAGGLVILFTQWNEIFPKNPLARIIAIIPITILLLFVGGYHAERYFVAWPNTPEVASQHSEAYTKLLTELKQNSAYSTVLNSAEETVVMQPLNKYFAEVTFLDKLEDVSGSPEERRLIITDRAYQDLSVGEKKQLGKPSRIVPSSTASRSTTLWIYGVAL